jgi:hypothetical protein
VLRGPNLHYHASPDSAPLGAISLEGASITPRDEGFITVATHGRTFQLQADTVREAAEWVAGLKAAQMP